MLYCFNKCPIVFVPENKRKYNSYYQSIAGKCKPDAVPVFTAAWQQEKLIDNETACDTSEKCAETVYHHHKQTLCTCPDIGSSLCFNKQGAGYIKEIESHAINDA